MVWLTHNNNISTYFSIKVEMLLFFLNELLMCWLIKISKGIVVENKDIQSLAGPDAVGREAQTRRVASAGLVCEMFISV